VGARRQAVELPEISAPPYRASLEGARHLGPGATHPRRRAATRAASSSGTASSRRERSTEADLHETRPAAKMGASELGLARRRSGAGAWSGEERGTVRRSSSTIVRHRAGRLRLPAVVALLLASALTAGAAGAATPASARPASIAATSSPASSARPEVAPACNTSTLVIWLDTTGDGTAGSFYYELMFTNLSGRACTLTGYPGVSAVSLTGRQLGEPASRNPAHIPRSVTIPAGRSAKAVLQIVIAGNYPDSLCGYTTAAGLRVYPPNQTASRIVPFPFSACVKSSAQILTVETVQST